MQIDSVRDALRRDTLWQMKNEMKNEMEIPEGSEIKVNGEWFYVLRVDINCCIAQRSDEWVKGESFEIGFDEIDEVGWQPRLGYHSGRLTWKRI